MITFSDRVKKRKPGASARPERDGARHGEKIRQQKNTFTMRVIKAALSIPKGRVTTYGRIAKASGGGTMASQSITAILGKAYDQGVKNIPFHRIVYADGKVWMSPKYRKLRLKLYKQEGIELDKNDRIKDFSEIVFDFK